MVSRIESLNSEMGIPQSRIRTTTTAARPKFALEMGGVPLWYVCVAKSVSAAPATKVTDNLKSQKSHDITVVTSKESAVAKFLATLSAYL
eukprot:CAMPEP_0176110144 /NCGR_PEP_ID=MMETSP0120_2-20121206/55307_1 /TAXON_ID=160619 /ORGANISM="Kryptoperidinium foliaceum, Strain CCMP 1326" /LENGTH=89 /DNA_ID=CAMNT_0017444347 /DNA_START=38 /DNA_END=304 /DNA_ORIENTATION=-